MQPVDATSGTRSLTTVQVAVPSTKTARTDSVVEQIPIVEPRPHYPISASVAEIMAHITELIKEQQTASQEALHQKNLDEARAEMEKLFEAVQGQTGNGLDGKKTDDSTTRLDVDVVAKVVDQKAKVPEAGDNKAKVPEAGDNKVTQEVKSANDANADGTSDQGSSGIQAKDDFSPSGGKVGSKGKTHLPHISFDDKSVDKKATGLKADGSQNPTSMVQADSDTNLSTANSGNFKDNTQISVNGINPDTINENI